MNRMLCFVAPGTFLLSIYICSLATTPAELIKAEGFIITLVN